MDHETLPFLLSRENRMAGKPLLSRIAAVSACVQRQALTKVSTEVMPWVADTAVEFVSAPEPQAMAWRLAGYISDPLMTCGAPRSPRATANRAGWAKVLADVLLGAPCVLGWGDNHPGWNDILVGRDLPSVDHQRCQHICIQDILPGQILEAPRRA
jgi:hypothetical protein